MRETRKIDDTHLWELKQLWDERRRALGIPEPPTDLAAIDLEYQRRRLQQKGAAIPREVGNRTAFTSANPRLDFEFLYPAAWHVHEFDRDGHSEVFILGPRNQDDTYRLSIPSTQDTPGVDDTPEAKKLQEGFRRLKEVDSGRPIADAIREHGTTIHFGPLEPDTFAQFDHQTNELSVSEGLKSASPNVLAAHLAHEGTHVQWVGDGKGYNTEDEIVNAEYAAFKNQADVWNEVKGAETDEQCDDVAAIMALGEDEAKDLIRLMYQEEIRQRRK